MIESPKVSVIIPFIFLNNYVLDCLNHCLSLVYPDFNLILLPDKKIILSSELMANPRIKIIETGSVSVAEKRNRGLADSFDAQYYAFVDSDAYPHKEWLKNGIGCFSRSKYIWAVGGPSICPPNENFKKRIVSNSLKSVFVSGIDAQVFRGEIVKNRYCVDLPTCNLIVKRAAIDGIGFFNKDYITGEDKEFCSRIIKNNKKIYFSSNAIVYHHSRDLFMPFIKQRLIYGLSVLKIIKKDYSAFNLCLLLPALFILLICILLGVSFVCKNTFFGLSVIILFYSLIIFFETLRWTSSFLEIPLTFLSIMIGNLMPGVGTILVLLNLKIDIRKLYFGSIMKHGI